MGLMDKGLTGTGDAALANPGPAAPASPVFRPGGTAYEDFYPYHAELCALSELRKKPGFGVPLYSGVGGHSLLYLNGVRLDRAAGYPVLTLCAPDEAPAAHGVGISVNSHYRNANWVAVEGRDFLWRGALRPGERLTRDAYARTQHVAREMGFLDGVEFHPRFFRDKPAGMADIDFKYEISVATDYALQFGRDVFRARVPLDHTRMAVIVAYLNALNAPYRGGERIYNWKLFNDNCAHAGHNALAAAGIWAPWATGQFAAFAAFHFPVPKNEFVDLMLRTNDLPLENAAALYRDPHVRRALLEHGTLPVGPGGLAVASPAIAENDVYDVARLRLIFYDNPFWGPYRFRFRGIFAAPRYTELRANLRHFAARYAAARQRNDGGPAAGAQKSFFLRYRDYIAREAEKLGAMLARLEDGLEDAS